jgi:hypothetical protein
MYELLLRIETLFLGLPAPTLLAIGAGAIVVGLVLWLGGRRHSAVVAGLFGALVGSAGGLLVGQQFDLHPWLSMFVGAAVVAGLAILLRNVLIVVLAVLVFSAVSGAGYVTVILDRAVPPARSETQDVPGQAFSDTRIEQEPMVQRFSGMDRADRLSYLDEITQEAQTFADRFKALLGNTWEAMSPHSWGILLAVVAGAVVGILLVWLIAKIVIALAYSIVGTAALFLGVQAALLAAGVLVVSDIEPRRWLLPIAFLVVVVVGWVWQLFYGGPTKPARESPKEAEPSA